MFLSYLFLICLFISEVQCYIIRYAYVDNLFIQWSQLRVEVET